MLNENYFLFEPNKKLARRFKFKFWAPHGRLNNRNRLLQKTRALSAGFVGRESMFHLIVEFLTLKRDRNKNGSGNNLNIIE